MGMEIEGLNEVRAKLDGLAEMIAGKVAQAVSEAGNDVAGIARKKAPTGAHGESGGSGVSLKNSISCEVSSSGGVSAAKIQCVAPHAQYVEFGTGIPVGHSGPWRAPMVIDGKKTYRMIYGMPPRPFMSPAMQIGKRVLKAKLDAIAREGK